MDFELSDEQRALRGAARDLLATGASSERVRDALDAGIDRELWKQVAAQGWTALELPADRGGLGLGLVEVAVLAEELGRTVAPVPYVSVALAIGALLHAADVDAPVGEWLDRLAAGELMAAAGETGGLVVDAPHAGLAVLADGDRVLAAELQPAPEAEEAMDRTRRVAWLEAPGDAVQVGGADAAGRLRDRACVAYAAEMLGASERMLEVATEYAKTREQFGRAIGSFQAVKHRLADMLVDVEGMRSAAYYAAWAVDAGADDATVAASVAKAWCGEASQRVLESALQVHGGIGFTWEHDLHLYLKRAHLDRTLFGDPAAHYLRVARLLEDRVEAGADLW